MQRLNSIRHATACSSRRPALVCHTWHTLLWSMHSSDNNWLVDVAPACRWCIWQHMAATCLQNRHKHGQQAPMHGAVNGVAHRDCSCTQWLAFIQVRTAKRTCYSPIFFCDEFVLIHFAAPTLSDIVGPLLPPVRAYDLHKSTSKVKIQAALEEARVVHNIRIWLGYWRSRYIVVL